MRLSGRDMSAWISSIIICGWRNFLFFLSSFLFPFPFLFGSLLSLFSLGFRVVLLFQCQSVRLSRLRFISYPSAPRGTTKTKWIDRFRWSDPISPDPSIPHQSHSSPSSTGNWGGCSCLPGCARVSFSRSVSSWHLSHFFGFILEYQSTRVQWKMNLASGMFTWRN